LQLSTSTYSQTLQGNCCAIIAIRANLPRVRCESTVLLAIGLLLGCGRLRFDSIDDDNKNLDAVLSLDGSIKTDAAAFNSATYCSGWTYCDTFDGDFVMPWSAELYGTGATIGPSTMRAVSGNQSLHAHRDAGRTENDGALYVLRREDFTECEFDIFVDDTFSAATPDLYVAFLKLGSPAYYYIEAAALFFDQLGTGGHWSSQVDKTTASIGAYSELYQVQPSRGQWLHAAIKYVFDSGQVAGNQLTVGAIRGPNESKTSTFPAAYAFDSRNLTIGVYASSSTEPLDAFFDNVRCK
jgi:hypothetical protein